MVVRKYPLGACPDTAVLGDVPAEDLLFFDIETTGLSARSSHLYLIGAVALEHGSWVATQWFAASYAQERAVLADFLSYAARFSHLAHFNGDHFDLRYLAEKCRSLALENPLPAMKSHDIYRMVSPLKEILGLSSLKQKSLEQFLGIDREDRYSGGELIRIYHAHAARPDAESQRLLLLHNYEDLLGMLSILPILSYRALIAGTWRGTAHEVDGNLARFCGKLPHAAPKPLTYENDCATVTVDRDDLAFCVQGTREPLKHFFPDYKNYWYLPLEDTAIHKSVGTFVDKQYRQSAKAATCYVKKEGFFLPERTDLFSPVFRKGYKEEPRYFAATQDFLADTALWPAYLQDLLA